MKKHVCHMDFNLLSDLSIESRRQLAGVSTSTVFKENLARLITQHVSIQKKGIYVPVSQKQKLPGKAPVYSEKVASVPFGLRDYQFFSNPLLIPRDYSANDHNAQLEAPSLRLTNAGFLIVTHEFDCASVDEFEENLKWLRGTDGKGSVESTPFSSLDKELSRFKDYRGFSAVTGLCIFISYFQSST